MQVNIFRIRTLGNFKITSWKTFPCNKKCLSCWAGSLALPNVSAILKDISSIQRRMSVLLNIGFERFYRTTRSLDSLPIWNYLEVSQLPSYALQYFKLKLKIFCNILWWVDLGWPPGTHQAALSLPLLSGKGGENKMKNARVKIKAI